MQKNWTDALKLCGFILMYEPHHQIAKEYLPILEKKVALLESQGESSSGSEGARSSDDDSSDSDSTEDDSDDNSTTDSSDDDEKEQIKKLVEKVECKESGSNDDDDIKIPGLCLFICYFWVRCTKC